MDMGESSRQWNEKLSTSPPQRPETAYAPSSRSQSYDEKAALHDFDYDYSYASPSTTVALAVTTNISDAEKATMRAERDRHSHSHRSSTRRTPNGSPRSQSHRGHGTSPRHSVRHYNDNMDEEGQDDDSIDQALEDKAMKLAILFSGPLLLLSFLTTILTFVSLLTTTLIHPIRLLVSRTGTPSYATALKSAPTSLLNLHFRSIFASSYSVDNVSLPLLLLAHILAPLLAGAIMIWSWITVVYWICSAIVGNPDGLDGRNDGRELILWTRRWWKKWLEICV